MMESSAYVYGTVRGDFGKTFESHEMPTSGIVTTKECGNADLKEIEATDERSKEEDKKESPDDSLKKRPQSPPRETIRNEILNETMGLFSETFDPSPQVPFQERNVRLCIFCQETPSEVIFEPCGHSLVCQRCSTWLCKKFCPRCRMDISKRKKSAPVFRGIALDLAVTPLTFSPYSFMDIS
jgi:hypothetical protein